MIYISVGLCLYCKLRKAIFIVRYVDYRGYSISVGVSCTFIYFIFYEINSIEFPILKQMILEKFLIVSEVELVRIYSITLNFHN